MALPKGPGLDRAADRRRRASPAALLDAPLLEYVSRDGGIRRTLSLGRFWRADGGAAVPHRQAGRWRVAGPLGGAVPGDRPVSHLVVAGHQELYPVDLVRFCRDVVR